MAVSGSEFGKWTKWAVLGLVAFVLTSPFYLSDMSSQNAPLQTPAKNHTAVMARIGAKPLRLATWNFEKGTLERIDALGASHFTKAASAIQADVLLVQEMTSFSSTVRLADHMGYKGAHIAVSDFNRDSGEWFQRLELAVISRIPIKSVREYDLTLDTHGPVLIGPDGNHFRPTDGEAAVPIPMRLFKTRESFPDDRGILRVELQNGLVLYNVHLTSNYPEYCVDLSKLGSELKRFEQQKAAGTLSPLDALRLPYLRSVAANRDALGAPSNPQAHGHWYKVARKREQIAAALAVLVARDVKAGRTVFAAGDFNTTAEEPCRSGKRLDEDADLQMGCGTFMVPQTCGSTDGFDDTLALLTEGLVDGLRMRPLSYGIGRTQHGRNEYRFPDAPIDHIFTAGPDADRFTKASKIDDGTPDRKIFASDHNPLLSNYQL